MTSSQPEKPFNRRHWWLLFVSAFVLPWIVVVGSNGAMASWFPGQFKVDHWRNLSSVCFLLGGIAAAALLLRLSKPLSLRLFGVFFVVAGSLLLAFFIQLRSKCGDESVYVGHRPNTEVASCN